MSIVFSIFRTIVGIYDFLSYPIYFLIDQPWKTTDKTEMRRSKLQDDGTWLPVFPNGPIEIKKPHQSTMANAIDLSIEMGKNRPCFGYRTVLAVESPPHSKTQNGFINGCTNGKVQNGVTNGVIYNNKASKQMNGTLPKKAMAKKVLENKYNWLSYNEVDERLQNISHGLAHNGVKYLDKVVLILETRMEWTLLAFSLIRMGSTLCTMFSTIGVDGYVIGIDELESEVIITNVENAQKLLSHASKIHKVKKMIVITDHYGPSLTDLPEVEDIEVLEFSKVENEGKKIRSENKQFLPTPRPDDLALIMYTSGTTGVPKGVKFTQQALAAALDCAKTSLSSRVLPDVRLEDNCYFAYLPSAHIFEFMMESMCFQMGVSIGFGSPFTAFEGSLQLGKDTIPDVQVLNPTLLVAVPLVLERIKTKIKSVISTKPAIVRKLFDFAVTYKNSWNKKGFKTRFIDRFLFRKTHDILGKRVASLIAGSAPLAEETQRFLRAVLNIRLVQGYGTTESQALALLQDCYDFEFGHCGYAIDNIKLSIRDWKDGGYTTRDLPYPRGELLIGGYHMSNGYFNRPDEDKVTFFRDHDDPSLNWFVSGDIVEIDTTRGTFKIIDRKKDLIKLQNGEFISLGKIESLLKDDPFVDNIMIVAPSGHNFVIAVVHPDKEKLNQLAKEKRLEGLDHRSLVSHPQIIDELTSSIEHTSSRMELSKIETPKKVFIAPDEWMPDSGLVTPSLKIRRKAIADFYKKEIDEIVDAVAQK